jgi:hypothetical protein
MNKFGKYAVPFAAALIVTLFVALNMNAAPSAKPVIPTYPTPQTIQAVPAGETVKAGTIVVLRYVDHQSMMIDVQGGTLVSDTVAGPVGEVSWDLWTGYKVEKTAERAACKQAMADEATAWYNESDTDWNEGYEVTLFGDVVPELCK